MPKIVGNNVIISAVDRKRKGSCSLRLELVPRAVRGPFHDREKKKKKGWLLVSSSWAGW